MSQTARSSRMHTSNTNPIPPRHRRFYTVAGLRGGGTINDAILHAVETTVASSPETSVIASRDERLERRFISKPGGGLERAALPYHTQRGLNDGLRDMEQMARVPLDKGDIITEGGWIYDPGATTWYSLGGETEYLGGGRATHTGR